MTSLHSLCLYFYPCYVELVSPSYITRYCTYLVSETVEMACST